MRPILFRLGFFTSRLGLFSACLIIVMASAFAYAFLHRAESIIVEHELVDLNDEARLMMNQLEESIAQLREDAEYLARLPVVDKIVRARMQQAYRLDASAGKKVLYDLVSGETEIDLRRQLFDRFRERCQSRPYFQVRLIGKYYDPADPEKSPVEGQEIVRAVRELRSEKITIADRARGDWSSFSFDEVRLEDLDLDALLPLEERDYNKSNAPYYKAFAAREPNRQANAKTNQTLYLSGIDLNREHGRIDDSYAQTLRASVPVMWLGEKTDPFFGILVINMDFDVVTDHLREHSRLQAFVTDHMKIDDETCRLLVHPDTAAEFVWDLTEDGGKHHLDKSPVRSQAFDAAQPQLKTLWQQAENVAKSQRNDPNWPAAGVTLGDYRKQDVKPLSESQLGRPLLVRTFKADLERYSDLSEKLQESVREFNFSSEVEPQRFRVRLSLDRINSRFHLTCVDEATLEEYQQWFASNDKEDNYDQVFQESEQSYTCDEFVMRVQRLHFDDGNPNRFLQIAIAASYDEFRSAFADTRVWIIGITTLIAVIGLATSYGYSRFLGRLEKRDAKQRKLLDQANRYKSAGLRGIWHELMPPMQLVLTKANAVREQLPEDAKESLADDLEWISDSSEEALDFLSNLREFAKCQDQELVVTREPFSIKDCIEKCVQSLQSDFEEKMLNVEVSLAMAPDTVWGNRTWIKHVVTNLLTNAKKYTDTGGDIVIRAEMVERPSDGVATGVRISVVDTGFGIPENETTMVFNDFHRCSNVKSDTPGVGIGLSFARRLVQLHDGEMGFESELDKGSEFWFTLPLKKEYEHESAFHKVVNRE